jgi:hypothetical protein
VTTALEAGMLGRDDDEHLAFAAARGRVLFSHNIGDYYRLHTEWLAAGTPHAGIVLARQQRYSVGELARRLLRLSAARTPEQMRNQIEFLSAW